MPESMRPILEREGRSVHLPEDAFEGMLRRRDRKRRRQRIGAAVTAIAVAAAILAALGTAFRDRAAVEPGAETIDTNTVASLHEVWSANVGGTSTPAVTGDVVAEANSAGHLEAFRVDCSASCAPLWTADVGRMPVTSDRADSWIRWWPGAADQPNAGYRLGSVTAADGVFFVMSEDGTLDAFDSTCRDDGGTCEPLWTAETGNTGPNMSLPIVSNGRVIVSGDAGIASYPVSCISPCPARWSRPSIVGALRSQDGHLYVTDTATGVVMELDPAAGATVWHSGPHPCCGNTPAPVLLGDRIYVNFGHLLAAYPTTCTGSCAAVWSIAVPDRFSDGPQLVGGTLVLSTARNQQTGGLWLLPLPCEESGSGCRGVRASTSGELTTQQPVSSGTEVFAGSTRNGGFWIFDTAACTRPGAACLPIASETSATVAAPYAPVIAGDLVFVADGYGPMRAFGIPCTEAPCPPLWSSAGMRAAGSPLVAGSRVFVADRTGMLHAYAPDGQATVAQTAAATSSDPGAAPWFYLALAIVIVGVYAFRRWRRSPVVFHAE